MKPFLCVPAAISPVSRNTFLPKQGSFSRCFHCSARRWAVAHPITAHGPPPKAPVPAPEFGERVERRKKQAELIQQGKEASIQPSKPKTVLKKRFWKDVHVHETSDGYQVLLDTRPVRTPSRTVLVVPADKRHLAEAISLEWDLLTSAQQALKQHLIPLTSLTSRADDIVREDQSGQSNSRQEILATALRYLETDTLLCWVPEKKLHDPERLEDGPNGRPRETLRDAQMRVAQELIGFLTRTVWPGIEIKPVLDADSIMPVSQSPTTIDVIREWISGLPAYELAGLERAILASKSLLVAAKLLVDWSDHFDQSRQSEGRRFGVEEATHAASLEVSYQTDMWGEVEDTHDVDREDLRRQFGSVVLLVSSDKT